MPIQPCVLVRPAQAHCQVSHPARRPPRFASSARERLLSLWPRPYQIIRRGCLSHAAGATWLGHPRLIRGAGLGRRARIGGHGNVPRTQEHQGARAGTSPLRFRTRGTRGAHGDTRLGLDVELLNGVGWHVHGFQQRPQFVSFIRSNRRVVCRERCGQLDRQLAVFAATIHQLDGLQGVSRDAISKSVRQSSTPAARFRTYPSRLLRVLYHARAVRSRPASPDAAITL